MDTSPIAELGPLGVVVALITFYYKVLPPHARRALKRTVARLLRALQPKGIPRGPMPRWLDRLTLAVLCVASSWFSLGLAAYALIFWSLTLALPAKALQLSLAALVYSVMAGLFVAYGAEALHDLRRGVSAPAAS